MAHDMTVRIGLTGGIGSGKSVVADIFRVHRFPVFDADKEAKFLNDNSSEIRSQLIEQFGDEIYVENKLDRKKFSSLIFGDKEKLKVANSIIHPVLAKHFEKWCSKNSESPLVVIDAAVLLEAGFNKFTDKVVTVLAPEELRIERVMKRDGVKRDKVIARMKHQMPEEEKIKLSDYVIYNDDKHSLIKQTDDLLDYLVH